eukprot:COSAG06_NODE_7787_length_2375_cov_1.318541_5_plen_111_part_00
MRQKENSRPAAMAFVAGKPLYTSPEASSGFFQFQSRLALEDPRVDALRCTKQVCGGSNRNGVLFKQYSNVSTPHGCTSCPSTRSTGWPGSDSLLPWKCLRRAMSCWRRLA